MFSQLKEVHGKVFYIKDALMALDSQLGHLQDLSALTIDTLKVISAVDTLQVEEALLADTKHQAYRKLPHSWSNAMYSKTLSSMECVSDKEFNYYSMPPSLLKNLARNQWPSENCQRILDALDYDEEKPKDKHSKQEIENDTLTSGVSSETKSTPSYGQFLLVPPNLQGTSFSDDIGLNLSLSDTLNELREEDLKAKVQTEHSSTAAHVNVHRSAPAERKPVIHHGQELDSVIFSPAKKASERVVECYLATQTPRNTSALSHPSHNHNEEPGGGYVNWGFSEDEEKRAFTSSKARQRLCTHSHCSRDYNCSPQHVQIKESKSLSYSSDRSGYSSDSSQSHAPFQCSTSAWINPFKKSGSFCKKRAERICKIKGKNTRLHFLKAFFTAFPSYVRIMDLLSCLVTVDFLPFPDWATVGSSAATSFFL